GRLLPDRSKELARLEPPAAGRADRPTVLVRVPPGVEAHTPDFIETATLDSKFGFAVHDGVALEAARRVVESPTLHFGGLHSHIGSMIDRLAPCAPSTPIVVHFLAPL